MVFILNRASWTTLVVRNSLTRSRVRFLLTTFCFSPIFRAFFDQDLACTCTMLYDLARFLRTSSARMKCCNWPKNFVSIHYLRVLKVEISRVGSIRHRKGESRQGHDEGEGFFGRTGQNSDSTERQASQPHSQQRQGQHINFQKLNLISK